MKKIFLILSIGLLILFSILMFNTIKLNNIKSDNQKILPIQTQNLQALQNLSKAITIQTISDPNFYRKSEFQKFRIFLKNTYPDVLKKLKLIKINDSILLKWTGQETSAPSTLIMAHYDTVPVAENDRSSWSHNPFSGDIVENRIWGRGVLDDKGNLIANLEAIRFLLKENFTPPQTVYFAFGADEEIGGVKGNSEIAQYFVNNQISLDAVFDEGMPILDIETPNFAYPVATINVAEKGNATFQVTAKGVPGHSSLGNTNNPIMKLSEFLVKIGNEPVKIYWPAQMTKALETFVPYVPWKYKFLLANLWLTKPLIIHKLVQANLGALFKNTMTTTKFNAGIKDNVQPSFAEATLNYRIIPGSTAEEIEAELKTLAKSLDIEVSIKDTYFNNPVPPAPENNKYYKILEHAYKATYSNVIVVPGVLIGSTDSKHYKDLTPNIYRITPLSVKLENRDMYHGNNESIKTDDFTKAILFYTELIQSL